MDNNQKLKQYELVVLDEFVKICKKYDLKYYLAFGSAIGAIRHQGFIPWDDDIDVHMPYDDLLKFKEICKKELPQDFYYQDKLNDKYYYNFWPKLGLENTTWMPKDRLVNCKYGICIDIFPVFNVKNTKKDKKRIEKYTRLLLITSGKYYVLNKKEQYSKIKVLIHQITPDFLNRLLYKYAYKKLSNRKKDYDMIVFYDTSNDKNFYFNKEVLEGNKTLIFENRRLSVPNDIDKYLTDIYGDYMTPPPEEKKYGHDKDNDIIYDFENSYKKYFEE